MLLDVPVLDVHLHVLGICVQMFFSMFLTILTYLKFAFSVEKTKFLWRTKTMITYVFHF